MKKQKKNALIKWLKNDLKDWLPLIVILVLFALTMRDRWDNSRAVDLAQKQIIERVARDREAMDKKIDALESELFEYRDQLQAIDEQIRQGAEEREEMHETIDSARTISDIDNALRKSARKPVGKRTVNATLRRPPGISNSTAGVDSNPY